jgi:hypothetical protein
VASDIDSLG